MVRMQKEPKIRKGRWANAAVEQGCIDTSERIFTPIKGKGSYKRNPKHKESYVR
jgi:hypothetical protein